MGSDNINLFNLIAASNFAGKFLEEKPPLLASTALIHRMMAMMMI